jgi:dynein heavy chain
LLPPPSQRHDDAHESLSPARLERIFIYCAAWGLGGLLDVRERAALDAELRSFGSNMPPRKGARVLRLVGPWRHCLPVLVGGSSRGCQPSGPTPCSHLPLARRQPEGDSVFEWMVDEATGEWRHWGGAVPAWAYPAEEERPKFAQLVIPTLDSVR